MSALIKKTFAAETTTPATDLFSGAGAELFTAGAAPMTSDMMGGEATALFTAGAAPRFDGTHTALFTAGAAPSRTTAQSDGVLTELFSSGS